MSIVSNSNVKRTAVCAGGALIGGIAGLGALALIGRFAPTMIKQIGLNHQSWLMRSGFAVGGMVSGASISLIATKRSTVSKDPVNEPVICVRVDPTSDLLNAAHSGDKEAIIRLVDSGISITAVGVGEKSILHYAAAGGQRELIEWLVDEMEFDIKSEDELGGQVLHHAAKGGHRELIKWLVDEKAFDINAQGRMGISVITKATEGNHRDLIVWLVDEMGVSVDGESREGGRILFHAAQQDDLSLTKWLVGEKGVELNSNKSLGSTALLYAAEEDNREIIEYLVDEKGTKFRQNVIDTARLHGHEGLVSWLEKRHSTHRFVESD